MYWSRVILLSAFVTDFNKDSRYEVNSDKRVSGAVRSMLYSQNIVNEVEEEPRLLPNWKVSFGASIPEAANETAAETNQRSHYIHYRLYNDHSRGDSYTSEDYIENFQPYIPTVFLIHGQGGSSRDTFSTFLRMGFADHHSVNVFVMDWEYMAMGPYEQVVSNLLLVADDLTRFLMLLKEYIGEPDHTNGIHLIGFGVGAHLAGNAGFQLRVFWPIARITGLDPTGHLFGDNTRHLSSFDAEYVEVIHTNGDTTLAEEDAEITTTESSIDNNEFIGIGRRIGDVDFFVNGGATQPGCNTAQCSHDRSWQLFASTLQYNHLLGFRCVSFEQMQLNTCTGMPLLMGGVELIKVPMLPGIYRLNN